MPLIPFGESLASGAEKLKEDPQNSDSMWGNGDGSLELPWMRLRLMNRNWGTE